MRRLWPWACWAVLLCTMPAWADWRGELRAKMSPTLDVRDVLDERGVFFCDVIGDVPVTLSWNGELSMMVDGDPVTDLEESVQNDGSVVIRFAAFAGHGTFGSTGTMGVQGWVYLDDLSEVRVDFVAGLEGAVYRLSSTGAIVNATAARCRCDHNNELAGCTADRCANAMSCPDHPGSRCGYGSATLSEFEAAFEAVALAP